MTGRFLTGQRWISSACCFVGSGKNCALSCSRCAVWIFGLPPELMIRRSPILSPFATCNQFYQLLNQIPNFSTLEPLQGCRYIVNKHSSNDRPPANHPGYNTTPLLPCVYKDGWQYRKKMLWQKLKLGVWMMGKANAQFQSFGDLIFPKSLVPL